MWPFKKQEVEKEVMQTPVEQMTVRFCKDLHEKSFREREEILQAVVRRSLPRKHIKYRAGQERY